MSEASIPALADELLACLLDADPLEATLIGYREYDAGLADLSQAAEAATAERQAEIRHRAQQIPVEGLSSVDAATRSVLIAQTMYADDARSAEAIAYTVAAFPVSPASVLLSYLRMVPITSPEQAQAYLDRLRGVPRFLQQAMDRLDDGRARGLDPVDRLVGMAVDQIDAFVASGGATFAIDPMFEWSDADSWRSQRDEILTTEVVPAVRSYGDYLAQAVRPRARDDAHPGLCHLPDGAHRYQALIRYHTTTNRSPRELHDAGLEIIKGVHAEFRELGTQLFGLDDVPEIFRHLQEDPSLRWRTGDDIVSAAEAAVRRAELEAPNWFGVVPTNQCAIEKIPELEAAGAAPAYYMPPAIDGSRPGTYFTNVNRPQERTTFDLESVAYHEAVPGHHFQISLALDLPLPTVRRLPLFTAYVEGWGLYSERLADQMGLYSSPLQRMGMLAADAWRASRLVVDTGLHAFGWSRQDAVDFMLANTPVAPIDVESEVDRYIAYPAQALSYMTGRMEIEALRDEAIQHLGDHFDIREFHDVVLGSGALPLAYLRHVVTQWFSTRA